MKIIKDLMNATHSINPKTGEMKLTTKAQSRKIMKNKLFEIKYGNGWLGSRTNIGAVLVLAPDIKTAKNIIKDKMNIKLGHIGPATQIAFLS